MPNYSPTFVLERALDQLQAELDEPSGAVMIPLLGIAHILTLGSGDQPNLPVM